MSKLTASRSEDVPELVSLIARLEVDDQERFFRIASLLPGVPASAQQEAQRLLRRLIVRRPRTIRDCETRIDEVIEYLETSILAAEDFVGGDVPSYVRR
jgi:hypothetical protein